MYIAVDVRDDQKMVKRFLKMLKLNKILPDMFYKKN